MNTLLVTFDLNPGANAAEVEAFLDRFDAMRFSPNSYALVCEESAEAMFQALQPLLGRDDLAYVLTLSSPWMGYGYDAMNDWLARHLAAS